MPEAIAIAIVLAAGAYALVGLLVAVAFLTRGLGAVDPAAARAPWSFRLMILPGVVALWPILARWWLRARGRPAP